MSALGGLPKSEQRIGPTEMAAELTLEEERSNDKVSFNEDVR